MISKKKKTPQPDRKKTIIENVRKVVCDKGQVQLFGEEVNYDSLEQLFKDFLEESGYIISNVGRINADIQSEKELVTYFYNLLNEYKKGRVRKVEEGEKGKEISLAKHLVKNRMEALDCSKKASLQVCANMIKTLIKFEEYYYLSYPVTNFHVFNKKSIDWIFTRTEVINNNPLTYCVDANFEKDEERFNKSVKLAYGEEFTNFDLWED